MERRQKVILGVLAILGMVYFAVFIPANGCGAADAGMLSLFEVDEFAQYPHVLRMLTPGDTPYQTLRNFTVYLHYYYGYPFYLFSALALLPVRLAFSEDWAANTRLLVTILRQAVSVLPMLLATGVLAWMQTRFRSWWRSVGLFLLLLAVPAVVVNNLWWHPDSLMFLFLALTLFFLDRDDQRFGRNFYLAAAACGVATGIKHMGLFFALAIPVYLLWGVLSKRVRWGRAVLAGLLFLLVMASALVLSNPLLLLPQERSEIIQVQKRLFSEASAGVVLVNQAAFFEHGWPEDVRIHYGEPWFVLLAFLALLVGITRPETRRRSAWILAWILPLTGVLLTFGTRRTHYFIPVMLPLFSSLVNLFPTAGPGLPAGGRVHCWLQNALPWILGLAILAQVCLYLPVDASTYREMLNRETSAPGITFYHEVEKEILSVLPSDDPLTVYRDWRIYFPAGPGRRVEIDWNFATHELIEDLHPDLVLLEKGNIQLFSDPAVVNQAANPGRMAQVHAFYAEAREDRIRQYRLVYEDDYAAVYIRDLLYDHYFSSR